MAAPPVTFIQRPPLPPHIHSNGHICFSSLYDSWSTATRVSSIYIGILVLLSSATELYM
jgi:ubiquitin-conjugating enzyme E2 W